jgi:hypothetical protein
MTTDEKLRKMAAELRRRPIPLADMIPLMLEAADVIEQQQQELQYKQGILDMAAAISRSIVPDGLTVGRVA